MNPDGTSTASKISFKDRLSRTLGRPKKSRDHSYTDIADGGTSRTAAGSRLYACLLSCMAQYRRARFVLPALHYGWLKSVSVVDRAVIARLSADSSHYK